MASSAAGSPLAFHYKCQHPDVGDDDDLSTASPQSTRAPLLEEPEAQRVLSEATDAPAVKVLSAPASMSFGAASPATPAAVRMNRTKDRLAEMLGTAAGFPAPAAAAPAGPPGRMCGVLSTEPIPSQDMAKVLARKAISGPVPSDPAAARDFRAKGRIARLLEQDAEGPRYVCGLRLGRDLIERSSRMGNKSSVCGVGGESSTENDEESVSRAWSKGSAGGEESMSRAWSKGSAAEGSMRACSKDSVMIPFYGRSPTWSVASDLSPKGERVNRFGMPLDMVTESENCPASSGLGESSTEGDEESVSRTWSKGSAGGEEHVSRAWSKGSAAEGSMRAWSKDSVAVPFYGCSPTLSLASDLSPKGDRVNRFGMPLNMVTESESCPSSNGEGGEASFGEEGGPARSLARAGPMQAEAVVTAPPAQAAGQGGHPGRTILLSLQPGLSGEGCQRSSVASSEGCSGPADPSHPYGAARPRWADVTPTASAGVQDFCRGFFGPPPRDVCGQPASFGAAAPPGARPPQRRPFQPPAALDSCGCLPGPARPAPPPASGARSGKQAGRSRPAPKEQRPRQPPQQPQPQPQRPPLAAPAGAAQHPAGEEGSGSTMRDQLRLLKDKDQGCVVLARRIHYLGFTASTQLEEYFKAFGPVQDVLVPRSQVKSCYLPSGSKKRQATVRERPAHLGFVVMGSAAGAEAAFAAGAEHTIGETTIVLEHFDEARWGAGPDEQQGPQ